MSSMSTEIRHFPQLVTLTEKVAILMLLLHHALRHGQGGRGGKARPHALTGRRVAAALATHAAF